MGCVADGRVAQQAADAGADEGDLLRAVDRAVVDEQLLGDAAFVEGGADGLHESVDVFLEEERTRTANSVLDRSGILEGILGRVPSCPGNNAIHAKKPLAAHAGALAAQRPDRPRLLPRCQPV
jgi:hypothetical protein